MFGNNSSSSTTSEAPNTSSTAVTGPEPASPTTKDSRRRSGSQKASALIASAKNSLSSLVVSNNHEEKQKTPKAEPKSTASASSPTHNNSAGESKPGPNSTFRVGVTEDRNKKCRRTMEDTHAYIYNFLQTIDSSNTSSSTVSAEESGTLETDNGYFAIFDGHAGMFAADWCGKKLHLVLEETIRKNPNTPIPELLDATFTNCDGQLEKLPMRNSGCTAVCAVLRWEDRIPSSTRRNSNENAKSPTAPTTPSATPVRQRILYTANVGDARIVLCRKGEAFRLSYDHKGSDENESRRVSNAGGLILNNRVNGVLAVTRALGDSYMKELVTGHPYTTETEIKPEDEFIILACDGLWDVCSDQEAVDLVRNVQDPQEASKILVQAALSRFSSDNLSCMIVRLDHAKKGAGQATETTSASSGIKQEVGVEEANAKEGGAQPESNSTEKKEKEKASLKE